MNPYNDVTFYDYGPMPYNGFYPRPEFEGGTASEPGTRRKRNQNKAAILVALEHYSDDTS